jgi:phage gpG-like protein
VADPVRVEGLGDLRRGLRQIDRGALKEVQQTTKRAAGLVAAEARTRAPRRSGALAASIKATTSGNRGIVRSRLPYAAVMEFGGVIRPRGVPIRIKRSEMVYGALERKQDDVLAELARGLDGVVRRAGFR